MISTWVWSRLPGPSWVKALTVALAFVAFTLLLFEWVFPWIAPFLPSQDETVG